MMKTRSSGFTLIELVIVLIIISLLAVLVTPTLTKTIRHAEIRNGAKRISAILRFCRSDAVNKRKVYLVNIDAASGLISVLSAVEGGDQPKPERSFPLPKEIKVEKVDVGTTLFEASLPSFEFYPNGGSNGGTAVVRGGEGRGFSIQVDFLTGSVKTEETE